MLRNKIASHDEWIAARKELLTKEKEFTRLRDELSRQRRELPWVKVEKEYVFDAPEGKVTLADLFDGRSQLFIKHFMMGPGQVTQCVGCSFEVDHIEGVLVHLHSHDVTYAVVARAPIHEIEGPQADGLALPLGLVLQLGFQLRLQRLLHARTDRGGPRLL
jgi:predicted dithiol-disulfide oxidoreductase (DUF899 family)